MKKENKNTHTPVTIRSNFALQDQRRSYRCNLLLDHISTHLAKKTTFENYKYVFGGTKPPNRKKKSRDLGCI